MGNSGDREYFDETNHDRLAELLVGRRVTKVADDKLELDDGRVLEFRGHDGGCSCGAGDYDLAELNGVDNVITSVEFEDSPAGEEFEGEGHYKIFVFAGNQRVNLATFEGSDGNGYYGTGYSVTVHPGSGSW